jgi:pimeloyl-ACP methyl ester carboxylesterase
MFVNQFLQHRIEQSGGRCYVEEIAGYATRLIQVGKGDGIVLWIPAFADPASSFLASMLALGTRLQDEATIVAADTPGFGDSASNEDVPCFREACVWAAELTERLGQGGRPLVVCGNSSGGALALGGAVAGKALVAGAVLVCWADWRFGKIPRSGELCPKDLDALRALLERGWHDPPRISAPMGQALVDRLSLATYREHVDSFDPLEGSAQLRSFDGPLAFIGGRSDGLVPPDVVRASAEARPGSILRWIDDCGHYPHRERRDELVELLAQLTREFLAQARKKVLD